MFSDVVARFARPWRDEQKLFPHGSNIAICLVVRAIMLLVCAGLPFWADVSYLERGGDLKWESLADFKNPEAF